MRKPSARASFSLVELVLALGIASFCLLTLMQLLATGLTSMSASTNETQALHLMHSVADDLQVAAAAQASPSSSSTSPYFGIVIPPNVLTTSTMTPATNLFLAPDGSIATSANGITTNGIVAQYCVTVGFLPDKSTSGIAPGPTARILVTWPAGENPIASGQPAAWPTNYAGSVETVFVLDN
jgi:Tfp pilus assembly protein PilV